MIYMQMALQHKTERLFFFILHSVRLKFFILLSCFNEAQNPRAFELIEHEKLNE